MGLYRFIVLVYHVLLETADGGQAIELLTKLKPSS